MATVAQRAVLEHQERHDAGSNEATQLVQMAAQCEDFKDVQLVDGDHPRLFATPLETWHQVNRQQRINVMNEPSIRKFDRGNRDDGRPPDQDPNEPKVLCPCCLRHGHDVEKGAARAGWEPKLRTCSSTTKSIQHEQNETWRTKLISPSWFVSNLRNADSSIAASSCGLSSSKALNLVDGLPFFCRCGLTVKTRRGHSSCSDSVLEGQLGRCW
jgi:hypothetical protein